MSPAGLTTRLCCFSARALPKPFPSSYNVGIDVARISRFETLITEDQKQHRQTELHPLELPFTSPNQRSKSIKPGLCHFIRKVFNIYEWPRLELALKPYVQAPDNLKQVSVLARYLAGRWAAKEAAIKAHSHRRLHYRDIIVLYQKDVADVGSLTDANAPVVLINPPKPEVHMSEAAALKRGIWRPQADTYRLAKTKMHERQTARVSISHDGDYVVSVVYAIDEPSVEQNLAPIIDDGDGEPMHEPLIGDAMH